MIEHVTHLMVYSGTAWVLWLLGLLSLISVAIIIERAWIFRSQRGDVRAFASRLHRLLREGDLDGAQKLLGASRSFESLVVSSGLAEAELGHEAASEAMLAATGIERARLEKRLLFLGTVGNNAPFVGLLGTVIGVVGAFEELGRPPAVTDALAAATALAPERVMSTIAEALVATAAGLIVAIPAVAAFNYFQGLVTSAVSNAETLGHVLLAHLKGRYGRQHEVPSPNSSAGMHVAWVRDSAHRVNGAE